MMTSRPYIVSCCWIYLSFVTLAGCFGHALFFDEGTKQNLRGTLEDPSILHLLGTDNLGRDILYRSILGAATSVVGPLLVAICAPAIATAIGIFAAYTGGWLDGTLRRAVEFMMSIPMFLVAIVVVGVSGGGYLLAVALLCALTVPKDIRVIRSAALRELPAVYIDSARVLSVPHWKVMIFHLCPQILPIIYTVALLDFAWALVSLTSLSYLGLGVPPGTADWGRMIAESRLYLFQCPAVVLVPACLLVLTASSAVLIGDYMLENNSSRDLFNATST